MEACHRQQLALAAAAAQAAVLVETCHQQLALAAAAAALAAAEARGMHKSSPAAVGMLRAASLHDTFAKLSALDLQLLARQAALPNAQGGARLAQRTNGSRVAPRTL